MPRDWQQEAMVALEQLKQVPHGDRERHMAQIACSLAGNSDASSLRRAIAAFEFLEKLKTPHRPIYESLSHAPIAVVLAVARWWVVDQAKASMVALDFGKGVGTAKSIKTAFDEIYSNRFGGRTGTSFVHAYASAARAPISEAIAKRMGGEMMPPELSVRDDQTGILVDLLFKNTTSSSLETIAVLIVGPYTNPKLYMHRCADWIAKGLALAWIHDRVVLVLPSSQPLDEYRRRGIIKNSKGGTNARPLPAIDVIHVNVTSTPVPSLTAEEDEALNRLDDRLL